MSRILLPVAAVLLIASATAQTRPERWIAVLDSPPVAEFAGTVSGLKTLAAEQGRLRVLAGQSQVRRLLEERPVRVLGASHVLVNAIFFSGSYEEAERVRALPGVKAVARDREYRLAALDASTSIVNAPAAWNVLGGEGSAGAGRRIGIVDSGIDPAHPSFQDDSLAPPAGFPRANAESDLVFTNRKVIVARSYVPLVGQAGNPMDSRPDDNSARDRWGHGTAVAAIAAGRRVEGPAGEIVGVAPKAFLGNYKIFGSPGVNDTTFTGVVILALEDAIRDGMDVVTLSIETPASYGALDLGCGPQPCDILAEAINRLAGMNVAVVAPAGNSGNTGALAPVLGSINSPGTAPAAITVGAISNGNIYRQRVRLTERGTNTDFETLFGNGPFTSVEATARYVADTGNNGRACQALGDGSLAGRIAIIDRGDCPHAVKVNNAQRAGAIAVVMVQTDSANPIFRMTDVARTGIPAVLISANDGNTIKQSVRTNPELVMTLDNTTRQTDGTMNQVDPSSSRGPTIFSVDQNDPFLKPELTAVGLDLYTATQRYDPNGPEYSSNGYIALSGTSYTVPMVAGAVALVKQRRPGWTPLNVKSAVVNTASTNVQDAGGTARVNATGAGKLDAGQAVNAVLLADPAALAFGIFRGTAIVRQLRVTNTTNAPIQARIDVEQRDPDARARVTVDQGTQIGIPTGQTTTLTVRLSGSPTNPGNYEGVLAISGSGPAIRVPYQYLVGDGVPHNIAPLGNDFLTVPGVLFPNVLFHVTDRFGVPVKEANMQWTVVSGGGSIARASLQTDPWGVGFANVELGPEPGENVYRATVGNLSQLFYFRTIPQPAIAGNGVVDAASGQAGQGLAPGSYVSIFGSGLAGLTQAFSTPFLPLSLTGVSVSFDVEGQQVGAPARLHFISPNQVNVQIPWEMRNFTAARMKVAVSGNVQSNIVTVPLNEFSPGIFEYDDSSSGRRMAAALDETNAVISGSNAVERGRVAQLYVNGLGRVVNPVASGEPASPTELNPTVAAPEVLIGGQPAAVQFSGLAPGFVGLYQVNAVVPAGIDTGFQPLVISIGGVSSQTSQLNIR
jgi:minor extracellular serine protease Vpr